MTIFWMTTFALAAAVTGLLILALLRGRRDTGPAEAFDLQVYRDQLKEVERDLARGTIGAEDAERLRTEVSRRILSADAQAGAQGVAGVQSRPIGIVASVLIAAAVLGGGFALYLTLGAPGYGDLALSDRKAAAQEAYATRPAQSEAEAQVPARASDASPEYIALVERLRDAVQRRPDDLQGHVLLARSEAALGNYVQAYEAQQEILRVKGDRARAEDYADLADMMVLAAGGYVSPEAERAIDAALARDPGNGVARYYGGLMWAQTGRPDAAFRLWDELLRSSRADDPWVQPIALQIEEIAMRAGVSGYTLPELRGGSAPPVAALPGPTQGDMEAAGEMSAAERTEMIQGMVARLSDRLATEGGTPDEWARLIGAYGVLGNEEQAIAIWNNAQEVFAENAEALETVRNGARQAGIAP